MIETADHLEIDATDGLRLHVVRSGRGSPVLLLHGFTGSAETWTPLRASLDQRFTIIAVDLPGHGRSSSPADPARYSLTRFADDLALVLDALGVERVAVLGYSLGARAALQFALRHPARVAALILESASPGIVDPVERAARIASDMALANDIERYGVAAFVERWERLPLWSSQEALPEETRTQLRVQRLANQPFGLANGLRGAGAGVEAPVVSRLAELTVPLLLVTGTLDAKFVALSRLMATSAPLARTATIADAGHAVHLERLAEFSDLVLQFLDSIPWAPRTKGHPGRGMASV